MAVSLSRREISSSRSVFLFIIYSLLTSQAKE